MSVIQAFTREQASNVARISERRASYWARSGVLKPSLLYDVQTYPHHYLYNFADVVGLRTLGLLRDKYKLSLQQLRKVQPYLAAHSDRPWSSLKFWVRGNDLLFSDPAIGVVSSSRNGQIAIAIELEPVAQQVRKDAKALSRRSRADVGQTERHRLVQGNRLLVKGTRVPVQSIYNLAADGFSTDDIVQAYPSLTRDDVVAVLSRTQQAAVA